MGRPISKAVYIVGTVRVLPRGERYRVQWKGGERSAQTLERAKRIAHDVSAQVDHGDVSQPNVTIGALASAWLNEDKKGRWGPKHDEKMRMCVKGHIIPRIGARKASTMKPEQWQEVLDALAAKGYSGSLINGTLQAMRGMVKYGQRHGVWPQNAQPLFEVHAPVPAQDPYALVEEHQVPTPEQLDALVEAMPKLHDRVLVRMAAGTGLRWAELTSLTPMDIDLGARKIRIVRQTIEMGNGQFIAGRPKTKAGVRRAPIPRECVEGLAQLMEGLRPDDLVFRSPRGGRLRRSNWGRRSWVPAREAAGWPANLSFHNLRHYAATYMVRAGLEPADIAKVIGHSNPNFTMARYVGGDDKSVDRALEVL